MKREVRILIVDDFPDVRHLYEALLHEFGTDVQIEIVAVTNSGDAFAAAKKQPFDLLITDLVRGHREVGPAFIRNFKRDHPSIPVVIISAALNRMTDCTKLGAFRFIPKPFDNSEFVEVIGQALGLPIPKINP